METMTITVSKEELDMFKAMCEETAGIEFISYDLQFEWAKVSYNGASSLYFLGAFFQNAKTKKMMGWH